METFFSFPILFIFQRNLLVDAHKAARGAVRGGPSISGQGEAMLLMVEKPKDFNSSNTAVLRSINELQPGGTVKLSIPHKLGCAFTPFQGESVAVQTCCF